MTLCYDRFIKDQGNPPCRILRSNVLSFEWHEHSDTQTNRPTAPPGQLKPSENMFFYTAIIS